jgi:hypothetical protein
METKNQQPEMEMTPEQLAEQKEKMLEFYRESMPYLRAQLDYEKLLLEIDETRFKRSNIQYQYAMMMNPSQEEDDDEDMGLDHDIDNNPNIPEQGKRKLKRG